MLPDPNISSPKNWTQSLIVTIKLVFEIWGRIDLRLVDYGMLLKYGWADIRCWKNTNDMWVIDEVTGKHLPTEAHQIWWRGGNRRLDPHIDIHFQQDIIGVTGVEGRFPPLLQY